MGIEEGLPINSGRPSNRGAGPWPSLSILKSQARQTATSSPPAIPTEIPQRVTTALLPELLAAANAISAKEGALQ